MSLKLTREGVADDVAKVSVPVSFEIAGARSEATIEMSDSQFELKDHRISIERQKDRGWGKVSIAAASTSVRRLRR